jgi:hypothetical protein
MDDALVFIDRNFSVIFIKKILSCNNVSIKDKEQNTESSRANARATLLVNHNLRIKTIFSTKLLKIRSFSEILNAIILIFIPDPLPLSLSQSSILL